MSIARSTLREAGDDHLAQWAAALAFYALLSLFPAMLALVSLLGLLGSSPLEPLIENVGALAPSAGQEIALDALRSIRGSSVAGISLAIALGVAVWSSSAYVGAFIPAANVVWEVTEARPLWKKLLVRVTLTVALLVSIALIALLVVLTGPIARQAGEILGVGEAAVTAWGYARWPALAVVVWLLVALLYWAAPNVHDRSCRQVVPGAVLALVLWIAASAGFSVYVSNFASYGALYGSIGGVLVLLLWFWLSNLALLLGAELDAELARPREAARERHSGL
jgi:membrane protein